MKLSQRNSRFAKMSAAAAAAFIFFSPIGERQARAQDPQVSTEARDHDTLGIAQTGDTVVIHHDEWRNFSGNVTRDMEIMSLINSERVMGRQTHPTSTAQLRVGSIDQNGVDFILSVDGSETPLRVNYDGTRSGPTSILSNLGLENFAVTRVDDTHAQVSFRYTDVPLPARQAQTATTATPRRTTVRLMGGDHDLALSPFHGAVDLSGRRRDFTLNNNFDIGGGVYSNEGGSSVWATARYALHTNNTFDQVDLRLSGGNIWFGEQPAPFARLFFRPSFEAGPFRAAYYGTFSTLGNMPSWLYTSHSIGAGLSFQLGSDARLRFGAVAGGALSFPAWDDIYFHLATGASFQYRDFLVYAMPGFYMAAPDPIKTAYIGYYSPQFQNIEFGIQQRFYEQQYTARLWADISTLNQRFGGRLTRSWNLESDVAIDAYLGVGASHWNDELGGRWDPIVMAGLTVVLGGRSVNSTISGRYEHLQAGGVRFARTDFPTQSAPGPYGFGRSGDSDWDSTVNTAKNRMLSAGSLDAFNASYSGAPTNQLINTARFMGAFLQQVAYANNAEASLSSVRQFDGEVRRIAGQDLNTMFGFMQRYIDFYNTHAPGDPLPEDLRNGIAVCAGIHDVMANFLRANGIPTIVASVNTRRGPHVIAIAMPSGATDLLDYGRLYETPAGTFDQAMRFYGQNQGAPTFQSQLFGPHGYMGTYVTSEGRLLHRTIGLDNMEILGMDFLGVR